jgi:hypothetical protein
MNRNVEDARIGAESQPYECDACGADVSFEDNVCPNCGADISEVDDGVCAVTDFRKQVGIVIRLPIVCVLGILWVLLLWWWLLAFTILGAAIAIVWRPLAFPFAYVLEWLHLAFKNSDEATCPGYFKDYPDQYLKWIESAAKLGFPTLSLWLFEGWDEWNRL